MLIGSSRMRLVLHPVEDISKLHALILVVVSIRMLLSLSVNGTLCLTTSIFLRRSALPWRASVCLLRLLQNVSAVACSS